MIGLSILSGAHMHICPRVMALLKEKGLDDVQVELRDDDDLPGFIAEATVRTTARTGVEMEAIIAVSIALVTVYDMAKSVDKGMVIGDISLIRKEGGKSGSFPAV